jgi:hypothetical protein
LRRIGFGKSFRLGLRCDLSGFLSVHQPALFDGVAFDRKALHHDTHQTDTEWGKHHGWPTEITLQVQRNSFKTGDQYLVRSWSRTCSYLKNTQPVLSIS